MKRRPISLLPDVHQTKALKRFFGSTVDQLFQPGNAEPVSGFIGRKPSYDDPNKDFYKAEPTEQRKRFQLEAAMVSVDPSTREYLSVLTYDDLLSRLNSFGAIIDNPSRLFSSPYYSWAPPVDIVMLNNFQNYYWSD